MSAADANRAIDAIFRIEAARLIAGLTRIVRDVGHAEELAQDALLAAIEQWPKSGIPDNPGAWLMGTAKHRAVDLLRRSKSFDQKAEQLGHTLRERERTAPNLDRAIDEDVGDDLLRLVFISCHPVLSTDARVALTLRLLGGLTTDEIARAFLVPEPTVAQRIVRAKRTLADAKVPFEVPRGADRAQRLSSVLEVLYLVFNEGYSATSGGDWMRPGLCEDAVRLGRILAELVPAEAEVHGLVALMEIQSSRAKARLGPSGEPVLLLEQNRARWDPLLIRRGLAAIERAQKLGGSQGPYALQAAIAACHATAPTADETEWPRIAALYEVLSRVAPSPVVEVNRAVALGMAFGPAAGLTLADALTSEPSLEGYHLLPTVRGDLLAKLGRLDEARVEFARAAALTCNARERKLLLERAAVSNLRSTQEKRPMLGNTDAVAMVAVKDLERARKFYQDTLGLKPVHNQEQEVIVFKSGTNLLNVYRSEFAGTNKATALTWDVGQALGEVVGALKAKGVTFEHYEMPGLKLEGDVHVGGQMKVAWFKDPDGNILSVAGR